MHDDLSRALEALGLSEDVSLEALESAWEERKSLYAEDTLATYALLSSEERDAQLAEIEAAYRKVKAALEAEAAKEAPQEDAREAPRDAPGDRRKEGAGQAAPARETPAEKPRRIDPAGELALPPPPPASKDKPERVVRQVVELPTEDLEAPGAYLRACREKLRLSLRELADRTRIRSAHLENIELEHFDALPPAVYVRGFVLQYARELGVRRPDAVAGAFLERCRAARVE